MNTQASKQTKNLTEKQSFCALDRKGQSKKGIGNHRRDEDRKKIGERRMEMDFGNSTILKWKCKCKLRERKEGRKGSRQAGRQASR